MKKNLVFKLGLFCAALVLVATCFVTNAWAKYTKTVTATDSARVAKFAFTVSEDGANFSKPGPQEITVFDTTFKHIQGDNDKNGQKLIAPGSTGTFTIQMANSSEVSLEFALTATDTNDGDIPVKWTYAGNATVFDTLKQCLEAATNDASLNKWQILPGGEAKSLAVTWSWAFEGDNDADTALGEAGSAVYTVLISCTATQVAPNAA